MKKLIIGALVGGFILFIWQFLSFALLNIHGSQMAHTPQQDAILEALASNNLEPGEYFLPRAPLGAPPEVEQAEMEKRLGQPWATLTYHESLEMKMGMNMFRGFVIDFVAVLLLCWVLLKFAELNFSSALISSIAVGAIGYFTINYLDSIWFETNSIPDLIDAVVQWGLCGAWLGWWLPRK